MQRIQRAPLATLLCLGVYILWSFVPINAQSNSESVLEAEDLTPSRSLGSQIFEINLGLEIPLFTHGLSQEQFVAGGNLTTGLMGSLRWAGFLDQNWAIGAQLAANLTFAPNNAPFGAVLIAPRLLVMPRFGMLDVLVGLSPGLSILSFEGLSYVGFGVKPEFGLYYQIAPNWSLGLNLAYWWLPEIYSGPTPPSEQTRFGNFLEVSLSLLYNF